MICIRLNFIEFKKAGKIVKKKKVLTIVTTGNLSINKDIYDRFAMITGLFLVTLENFFQNKLNSHNYEYFFWRVFFIISTEVIFDWLKGSVLLKISNINPINYKKFYFELALFYEKCRYRCFKEINGIVENESSQYINKLQTYKFGIINSQNNSEYCGYLDDDNLSSIEAGSNNLTFSILFLTFLLRFYDSNIFCLKTLLVILCLLLIRSINKSIISRFVVENIDKFITRFSLPKAKKL